MIQRAPRAALAPFVERLWAGQGARAGAPRERVVPTGAVHLVVRLSEEPLRIFSGPEDREGVCVRGPLVGGARDRFYLRDVSRPAPSVGVMLRPGAARALLGVPAGSLTGRHTVLRELWGTRADELVERLVHAPSDEARLELLEEELLERLAVRRVDRRVRFAAEELARGERVADVAAALGKSPRRFGAFFEAEVGLAPKRYAQVLRVQSTLALAARAPQAPWPEIAQTQGYADQAHLTRELRAVAGVTPGQFRALAPESVNHLPVGPIVR